MRCFLLVVLMSSAAGSCSQNRSSPEALSSSDPTGLEGVWEPIEVIAGGESSGRSDFAPVVGRPQPGLRIFTRGYYTYVGDNAAQPRSAPPPNPTAEELIAAWGPFGASGGPYEVHGDTIIMQTVVAKNPPRNGGVRIDRFTFQVVSDSMWITNLGSGAILKYRRLE